MTDSLYRFLVSKLSEATGMAMPQTQPIHEKLRVFYLSNRANSSKAPVPAHVPLLYTIDPDPMIKLPNSTPISTKLTPN